MSVALEALRVKPKARSISIMFTFVAFLSVRAYAADATPWTWTGKKLVVCREKMAAAWDPEVDKWTTHLPPPFFPCADSSQDPRHYYPECNWVCPISEQSILLVSLDSALLKASVLSLRDSKWSDAWSRQITLNHGAAIAGLVNTDKRLVLVISPPPAENIEFEIPGAGNAVIPGPPADPPDVGFGAGRNLSWFMELLPIGKDSVFAFGINGKSNPCYLWNNRVWELIPLKPLIDEKTFGGPVPRAGYTCCLTDSEVIIFGGDLTWSSSIAKGLPGIAYSLASRSWRKMEMCGLEGLLDPVMCWTGQRLFIAGTKSRHNMISALVHPVRNDPVPLPEILFKRPVDHDFICFSTGKAVCVFTPDASEGFELDLESREWRSVLGLIMPEEKKKDEDEKDK